MVKHQWICFIFLELMLIILLSVNPEVDTVTLFLLFNLMVLILRKALLIKDNLFIGAIWLRRSIYFLPHILVFNYYLESNFEQKNVIIYCFIAIFVGILFIIIRIKEISPFFMKEFLNFLPPISSYKLKVEVFSLLVSAIMQELFYKGFVIVVLLPKIGVFWALIISSLLFVSEHILHHSSSKIFMKKDFILQFLLSLIAGMLFVLSGSLIVAVMVHFTYNLPIAITYFLRYRMSKVKLINDDSVSR